MKTSLLLLRIAGIVNIPFILFHAAFYKLFKWDTALECLSQSDRSIFLTYHYISIIILTFMVAVSLFQAKKIIASGLKYSLLGFFSLFYIIRIITEFTLFGINQGTPIILLMCAIPTFCYVYPMLVKTK
jgi:hypothetical protein